MFPRPYSILVDRQIFIRIEYPAYFVILCKGSRNSCCSCFLLKQNWLNTRPTLKFLFHRKFYNCRALAMAVSCLIIISVLRGGGLMDRGHKF